MLMGFNNRTEHRMCRRPVPVQLVVGTVAQRACDWALVANCLDSTLPLIYDVE